MRAAAECLRPCPPRRSEPGSLQEDRRARDRPRALGQHPLLQPAPRAASRSPRDRARGVRVQPSAARHPPESQPQRSARRSIESLRAQSRPGAQSRLHQVQRVHRLSRPQHRLKIASQAKRQPLPRARAHQHYQAPVRFRSPAPSARSRSARWPAPRSLAVGQRQRSDWRQALSQRAQRQFQRQLREASRTQTCGRGGLMSGVAVRSCVFRDEERFEGSRV